MKQRNHCTQVLFSHKGFTLVELLVAMGVSGIVMMLVGVSYWMQTQTSREQKLVLEMQQNMRSAVMTLKRDLRMAGFGLDNDNTFTTANQNTLAFSYVAEEDGIDNDGDGTTDEAGEVENIQYSLFDSVVDADGDADDLQRTPAPPPGLPEPPAIAGNIQNIEFFYTEQDGTQSTNPADNANIRAVGISILVRTESPTRSLDNSTYTTLSGTDWGPFNDRFERQIVTTVVQCRNMIDT